MKMKEIINENDIEKVEDCDVCETHSIAYDKIKNGIICPYCNELNEFKNLTFNDDDYIVVGEENIYEPDHEINKYISFQCLKCGEDIILIPEKVIYNANHDIFYSGGKSYLNDKDCDYIFDDIQKEIEISIRNYTERILSGEKLDSFYPALWSRREIEKCIADYLFKKGIKANPLPIKKKIVQSKTD